MHCSPRPASGRGEKETNQDRLMADCRLSAQPQPQPQLKLKLKLKLKPQLKLLTSTITFPINYQLSNINYQLSNFIEFHAANRARWRQ